MKIDLRTKSDKWACLRYMILDGDADLTHDVFYFNTRTKRVGMYVRDAHGKAVVTAAGDDVVRIWKRVPRLRIQGRRRRASLEVR